MDSTNHKHPDFTKAREAEGRQDFEVIIRGHEEIHLTTGEISEAVYALVKAKADAMGASHPFFDIEVSTSDFAMFMRSK